MKIVADAHIPFIEDYFAKAGELVLRPGRQIANSDLLDADVLLVRSVTPVNRFLLDNTPVKFVGSVTAGTDHLDTAWLKEAGIDWGVASGFNAPPVADYVLSVVAGLQRKNLLSQHCAKVAIIGVGNVGKLVAEKLKKIGYQVILCDPWRAENEVDFLHCTLDQIEDVDLICLHVPLVREGKHPTYHFINKEFLQRQKPGCVLLNAARGAVIHSDDLLTYGQHLLWCLDVWEHEPNIDKRLLENATLATPHIAGYSVQSKIRGTSMIYHAALTKNIISSQAIVPSIEMTKQTLSFAGGGRHWQDIVLGVFNPLILSAMCRATLLPAENRGELFDEMRHQFNYRYELAYTKIVSDDLLLEDKKILENLGLEV